MARRRRLGWIGVALGIAGCAVYTSGIRPDAVLDPESAYLYGRFFMKDERYGAPAAMSMGLVIGCEDGHRYAFGSIPTRDIQVLEIRPSRCALLEVVWADDSRIVRKRVTVDPSLQRRRNFSAGRAHYLGDYYGKADSIARATPFVTHLFWHWAMSPADDRYEATTGEMQRTFPNLASLPTMDARLIPEPERKLGNGIVAAPGEPPLSLERVARLAPLIKRNYATPAECEAACPLGQCLPYRGESGPAMACVIHCNRDRDCPDGLACNCPNSEEPEGPDCEPIATAPGDPMARICLSLEDTGQRR